MCFDAGWGRTLETTAIISAGLEVTTATRIQTALKNKPSKTSQQLWANLKPSGRIQSHTLRSTLGRRNVALIWTNLFCFSEKVVIEKTKIFSNHPNFSSPLMYDPLNPQFSPWHKYGVAVNMLVFLTPDFKAAWWMRCINPSQRLIVLSLDGTHSRLKQTVKNSNSVFCLSFCCTNSVYLGTDGVESSWILIIHSSFELNI